MAGNLITRRAAGIFLSLGLIAGAAAPALAQTPPASTGKVKVEWLGHEFYRFTSPNGVVVITSPWLTNPDGPVTLDELAKTDFILVPNAHNDDMGSPVEIAAKSGAMVITPGPLGNWLIGNGLKKEQFRRSGVGDQFTLKGITFKIAPSHHDNTMPNGVNGGPAVAFFITFENGFTVFYNGHSTMIAELAMYAENYKPSLAILGLAGDPPEFAQVARMMTNNNPKLKTIWPSHQRPGAPIFAEGKKELDKFGLGALMAVPDLRKAYEY
jgi:L-ascorbate metabolism protein UlaG (beta-lactamase superfamily)